MLIKLAIMVIVSAGLLMAFSTEIRGYFPNTITIGLESFKLDVIHLATQSLETAEQKVDSSSQKITEQLSTVRNETLDSAGHTINYAEDQLDSAAETLVEEITGIQDSSAGFQLTHRWPDKSVTVP